MFRNLRFYRITSPWPESEEKLSETLAVNAFSPCGAYSERTAGWEAPAEYDDAPAQPATSTSRAKMQKLRAGLD